MSTLNLVRYYFYKGYYSGTPAAVQVMITLAYQTVRDLGPYPKAIVMRYR